MNQKLEEEIKIANKDISKYLTACFFAWSNDKEILNIIARGNNIKRAVDVGAIVLREHLDIPSSLPTIDDVIKSLNDSNIDEAKELLTQMKSCEIKIGSEKYNDGDRERFVSTINIYLRGKRKDGKS